MTTTQNYTLLKTEFGARFFQSLAEADPEAALENLKRTVGTWDKDELSHFTTGRRQVIWSLEKIARWRHLFADAARLLLALGETENETWSNNASGVFAGLFVISWRREFSPTEASPQERFPILKEALESDSKERRTLGLQACDHALRQQFWGQVRSGQRIFGKEPELWVPATYDELFDAYRQVWRYLVNKLDELSDDERQEAVRILLRNTRYLNSLSNLSGMVIDTMNELTQKSYVDRKSLLEAVLQILRYDAGNLPEGIKQQWEDLRDRLTGAGFHALMQRYVGIDIFEDKVDEDGNLVDQAQPRIEELAQQAIENPDLLQSELDWLISGQAQNSFRFGHDLGRRDLANSFLPMLIEAQKSAGANTNISFLSGYLFALFERDEQRWERLLHQFAEQPALKVWVPEISWRSGNISDKVALLILQLARDGVVAINYFGMFVYGKAIQGLSEGIFQQWIEFLLDQADIGAIYTALALYLRYYDKNTHHQLPEELTLKLLTHPLLFQSSAQARQDQMVSFHWESISTMFLQLYPSKGLELANMMLEHFGKEGTIFDGIDQKVQTALYLITELFPSESWNLIVKYLGSPKDSRAYHITQWLRGGDFWDDDYEKGALSLIPPDVVWRWVDENIEKRAWYLASFVPKELFRDESRVCWAREVLVRYGDREDVRQELMANFSTEGWTGPESLHLQTKKQSLLDFRTGENDENVRRWIDEYIYPLQRRLERAKVEEEREDF